MDLDNLILKPQIDNVPWDICSSVLYFYYKFLHAQFPAMIIMGWAAYLLNLHCCNLFRYNGSIFTSHLILLSSTVVTWLLKEEAWSTVNM